MRWLSEAGQQNLHCPHELSLCNFSAYAFLVNFAFARCKNVSGTIGLCGWAGFSASFLGAEIE